MDDARIGVALVESVRTVPIGVRISRFRLKEALPQEVFWFFPPHGDILNLDAFFRRGW